MTSKSQVRQESIDLLKGRLTNQIMSFKKTIAKVLDKFRNISPEKMRKEKVENYLRKVSSVKILSKIGREIFLEENCWKLISKGGYSRNQKLLSIFDSIFGKYLSREDEERKNGKIFKESIPCQNTVENWQKFGNQSSCEFFPKISEIFLCQFLTVFLGNISPEKMRKEKNGKTI